MGRVNVGICETCRKRIPTRHEIREGKVYICKDCPDCGLTEALISSDAAATWPEAFALIGTRAISSSCSDVNSVLAP